MTKLDQGTSPAECADFMLVKIATARFYAEHILNKVPGTRDSIVDGAESMGLAIESF